jgi:hypothetical protein
VFALQGGLIEALVSRQLSRRLPDRLDGVQFRRVRRQTVQANAMSILMKPSDAVFQQTVEGSIVDYEKDLAVAISSDEEPEKAPEGIAGEALGELIGESRIV